MTATRRTIIIIDEELRDYAGHPYEYNKSVAATFRQQGFDVELYASAALLPEIRKELSAHAWFLFSTESPVRRIPILGGILYRQYFARAYKRQMDTLIADVSKRHKEFILFQTNTFWYNIVPLARSWSRISSPAAFLLRISIYDTIRVPALMRPFILPVIRYGAKLLNRNSAIHAFSDSEVIAGEWEREFGRKMTVLPIPHLHASAAHPYDMSQEKVRLYLPGSMRLEKGAGLLVRAMELLSEKYPDVARRVVLATQFPGKDVELLPYKERLAALPITNDFLGYLSSDEYNRQLEQAAIILIPYQASEGYRARTSGVLAEAIGAQKPSITTKGTWMALQVKKLDAGLVIDETPEALVTALLELIGDYPSYQAKIRNAADQWVAFHSKVSFFELFMNALQAEAKLNRKN